MSDRHGGKRLRQTRMQTAGASHVQVEMADSDDRAGASLALYPHAVVATTSQSETQADTCDTFV